MTEVSDMELLRCYREQSSEPAFAKLVQRHLGLVYSAALRHVGIAAHAEEVTQAVFIVLARKAGSLRPDTILESWLYTTTRLTALSFLRGERRRQFREQEAYMQSTLQETARDSAWDQLAPLLDEGMSRLGKKDRDAVMLRFFKDKSLREVATVLNVNERAAQKRVHRAVEKLRQFFTKRGIILPAAVLTSTISANSIQAAPAALAETITAIALAKGATASLSTLTLVKAATIKGAATFGAGSVGGLFATIGSAYVSLKAHADDSKSPRERQFMVRVFRKRMTVYSIWLALYVVGTKCGFFQTPLCFDFFLAAFIFYFFCVDLMILGREQGLRRRQIQIEDNTYVKAEWTMPRKITDPTVNVFNVKNMLKALRFWIFGSILVLTIWFQLGGARTLYQAWKVRSKFPAVEASLTFTTIIVVTSLAAAPYTNFLQWKRRPRFGPIRGDGPPPRGLVVFPIMFPIVIGLLTLAIFNVYQRLANDGRHDSSILASPAQVLVFNLVVVSVYTAFTIRTMGILARRRKNGYGTDKNKKPQ